MQQELKSNAHIFIMGNTDKMIYKDVALFLNSKVLLMIRHIFCSNFSNL